MENLIFDILDENPLLAELISYILLNPLISIETDLRPRGPLREHYIETIVTERYIRTLDIYKTKVALWCIYHSKNQQLYEALKGKLEKEPLLHSSFGNIIDPLRDCFMTYNAEGYFKSFNVNPLQDYLLIVSFLAHVEYDVNLVSLNNKFDNLLQNYRNMDKDHGNEQMIYLEASDLIETFKC